MSVIKICTEVHGHRFWRQAYTERKPLFEVFECVGYHQDTGQYVFRSVKEKTMITKGNGQLFTNGFEPFVYGGKQ